MRKLLIECAIIGVWALVGIVCVFGWIMPDGCPAADVIFHHEACEGV